MTLHQRKQGKLRRAPRVKGGKRIRRGGQQTGGGGQKMNGAAKKKIQKKLHGQTSGIP